MKAVILCGGKGTRLREETELKPKPMVSIGGMPIVWHIMKTYAHYGIRDFVLCLGYKGHVIKDFFLNYEYLANDFTIQLGTGKKTIHPRHQEDGWSITLADTGEDAMTGARVKRIARYIEEDTFLLTYGDGVANVDVGKLLEFHNSHGKLGTVTGVFPPSRYGELVISGDQVSSFSEKPDNGYSNINGGYFVFNRAFFDYLSDDDECILERAPLERLADDGQLCVYNHKGFWQCMDTFRDYTYLNRLWDEGTPHWKVWK